MAKSDPASQWTRAEESRPYFAYADDYLIDTKCSVIIESGDARRPAGRGRHLADHAGSGRVCCTNRLMPVFRLSPDGLISQPSDGNTERGVAVWNGDADLEFCDLAVEVARHEALAQQMARQSNGDAQT